MDKTIIYIANVLPLEDENLFNKYYALMPKYRQDKIDKYAFNNGKILSLGVGILLNIACADLNITNKDIYFNEYNKPYFNNEFYFNLSHSGKMAICALSSSEVGCDIEEIKELKEKVANKVFTEKEKEIFKTNTNDGFYLLWTLKESYLKKIGKGLAINPLTIEFNKEIKLADDLKTNFFVKDIDNYKIAVAFETKEIEIKIISL